MKLDDLVKGSIDMHVHFIPNPMIAGRIDAWDTAKAAAQMGMRAIVLKSTLFPSGPLADLVGRLVPEVKVFGGVCLDYEIGGLNHHALEPLARLGAKMVWMPTHSSSNSRAGMRRLPGVTLEGEGFSIIDGTGQLVPEMARILSIIKQNEMVLANGHISPKETFALVEGAKAAGITRLVITHGLWTHGQVRFTLDELKRLAEMCAYIELCYVGFLPTDFRDDPKPMSEAIKYIGAEHFIMSTDLGQYYNPTPAEGMRMFMALMLKNGISELEIELMTKENPAKLLGLE
jgi:hypothetical protein